jgi:nickel transport protein
MKYRLPLALALVILLLPALVQAHNVSVFALVEEGTVIGETYFSGGKPAKNSRIVVLRGDTEEELLSLQTDQQGRFSFPIPETALKEGFDLKIVLLAGEAHRNEWLIGATEFLTPETATPRTAPATAPGVGDIFAGLGFILGGGVLIWLFRKKRGTTDAK